ncbi:unnamed protein product [Owenia fusiformis]|uniref:G-protein coupled receptors family 1 profile domain-containing protein n=1 Tax=Owenia fusiformis TaxID=6347 RepID=A0A8S4NX87_OWEFU|nr:unnamed protein product [Owenia fusiformis]
MSINDVFCGTQFEGVTFFAKNNIQHLNMVGEDTFWSSMEQNNSLSKMRGNETWNAHLLKPELPRHQMIVHMSIEILLILLTCCGNIVVLISIWLRRSLQTVNNMFLASLSLADLIMGTFASPLSVYILYMVPIVYGSHIQDKWLCTCRYFAICMSVAPSLFSLSGIAIDRYIAVVYPIKYRETVTRTWAVIYLIFSWIYCTIGSAMLFYKNMISFDDPGDFCRTRMVMHPDFSIIVKAHLGVLFLICSISHITIAFIAYKRKNAVATELNVTNSDIMVQTYKRQKRITRTMTLICGVFVLCWLPWVIMSLISLDDYPMWWKSLFYFTVELSFAGSAVNPWIYAYRHRTLRKAMLNVLKCKYKRLTASEVIASS